MTVGVNLVRTKLLVFALAAGVAGLGGGLLGMYRGTVGSMDFEMLVGIPILLLLVVGGVGTVSGALIGGVSTVALLIVQDEVTFVVFGVSVLVALTRIGPGLVALGVSRNPEGLSTQFRVPWPSRTKRPDDDADPSGTVMAPGAPETITRVRASSSRGG